MTLSSAYIELFIRGKSPGEMSGGEMSGYHSRHTKLFTWPRYRVSCSVKVHFSSSSVGFCSPSSNFYGVYSI